MDYYKQIKVITLALSDQETYKLVFTNYPDIVSISQMSEMLGICTKTAYRLIKEDKIKHLSVGHKYLIPKVYILNYLKIIGEI